MDKNCLICQGGSISMNPLALNELQAWHYAGHPNRQIQVTGLRLDDTETTTQDTVTSPSVTIEDKLNKILWELYNVRFPRQISSAVPDALHQIQAIITTETTKAREDERKKIAAQIRAIANDPKLQKLFGDLGSTE